MRALFLDTGYIVALELSNDQWHSAASAHWRTLLSDLPPLVTTSYVFDEVVTMLKIKGSHDHAIRVGQRLLTSPRVDLLHVDAALFDEGWIYFQRHSDKAYSLTDSLSFVVMHRLGIATALAFDRHFVQAGFAKLP